MSGVVHRPIRTHLAAEDHERLEREAATRGITVSQCIRECLREYFGLRAEVATALDAPREASGTATSLLHSLLAQTEGRLVAALDAHADAVTRVQAEARIIQAMIDRLVFLYLAHTPEMPGPQRDAALESGTRRHLSWRRAAARLVQDGWSLDGLLSETTDGGA